MSELSTNDGHRPWELVAVVQLVGRLGVFIALPKVLNLGNKLDVVCGSGVLVQGCVPRRYLTPDEFST